MPRRIVCTRNFSRRWRPPALTFAARSQTHKIESEGARERGTRALACQQNLNSAAVARASVKICVYPRRARERRTVGGQRAEARGGSFSIVCALAVARRHCATRATARRSLALTATFRRLICWPMRR